MTCLGYAAVNVKKWTAKSDTLDEYENMWYNFPLNGGGSDEIIDNLGIEIFNGELKKDLVKEINLVGGIKILDIIRITLKSL